MSINLASTKKIKRSSILGLHIFVESGVLDFWEALHSPFKLRSMTFVKSVGFILNASISLVMPALFTRMSI